LSHSPTNHFLFMKQRPAESAVSALDPNTNEPEIGAVLSSIFDFFGTLDNEGRVVHLEGRIFQRTNTNPSLLVGQRFAETVFWQSSEHTSKLLGRSLEGALLGEPSDMLLDFRISADEKVPMEVSLRPMESGRVFCCAKSISDRDKIDAYMKESEHLLFAAENAEIGLWFWDFAEDKIYSTPQCNELLGWPAYEILTYDAFLAVVHPDDRVYADEFLQRSRQEGARYEEEFRVVYPDQSIDWLCAQGKSFLDAGGNPQRMMGVLRRITGQKLAAEELERVYEREKKARDEAEDANRAKDFFLAFVSHELRSPLNAILGWAKILLTKEVDDKTRRNALETIERSARFQTKLINDLVDSARVASGKLRLEYHLTNLNEIVRVSFEAQRPAAEAHHIDLEFSPETVSVPIFGDAGRLQQVFTNLLSNAIKFTPEGGKVSVTVKGGDETASVSVRDSGQGIAPDVLPLIFRQFSQGESNRGKNNAGLGLGLSIVNILVAKHGGTVRAESEGPGEGSEFIVTLPISNRTAHTVPEKAVSNAGETGERPLHNIKVLIVEDDPDSREVLQLCLEQNGAAVLSANSAASALELLEGSIPVPPDVIISDLAMPQEDGYALMSRIRRLPADAGGDVPSIALSAFANAESRTKAFESGFQKYSTKPFDPDGLIVDILELVGS